MRAPDEKDTIEHKGLTVDVSVWWDPTDCEWDGCEPLEENAEGWDLYVKVETTINGFAFSASDALGSIWIVPNLEGSEYLRSQRADVTVEALHHLENEIARVANGADVVRAKSEQKAARALLRTIVKVAS